MVSIDLGYFQIVMQSCNRNNLDIGKEPWKSIVLEEMKHMLMQSNRIEFHINVRKSISDYHCKNFIFIDL